MKAKSIVLAMLFCCCFAAAARAESFILFRQYDRDVFHPYEGYTLDDTRIGGFRPTFRQRFTLNLELKPFAHIALPGILVRFDVKLRESAGSDEPGHFNPLSTDMGGGALWKFGNWVFTIFGSSEHFFNGESNGQSYNYAEVKYIISWPWRTTH